MTFLNSIDALLFDLGGIVIDIDFNRIFACWAAYSGEQVDMIKSRFSFDSFYKRHERGEIPANEYFASLRSSLQIDLSDDEFIKGWNAIYVGHMPGIVELLQHLKEKIPVYAFTNSNPTHQQVWAKDYGETLNLFGKVFVSSEMGKRKPEPEAFKQIATEIDVSLNKILFFDDIIENIEGAQAVGMQAALVRSIADVENRLVEFL